MTAPTDEEVELLLRRARARFDRPSWPWPGGAEDGVPLWAELPAPVLLPVAGGLIPPVGRFSGWIPLYAAGVLVILAVPFAVRRVRAARQRRRCRAVEAAVAMGDPAWDADWLGDRTGAVSGPLPTRRVPKYVSKVLTWIAFVTYILVVGRFASPESQTVISFLPAAAFLVTAAWLVARDGAHVRFGGFPEFTGRTMRLFVATTAGSPHLDVAECRLRCVLGNRTTAVESWSATAEFPADAPPGPDEFVGVAFDVPDGLPGTCADPESPVRWEIVVRGGTRWGLLVESFDVPVYAPVPGPAALGGPSEAPGG